MVDNGEEQNRVLPALLVVLNGLYFGVQALLVLYAYEILHRGNATYAALLVATAVGAITPFVLRPAAGIRIDNPA